MGNRPITFKDIYNSNDSNKDKCHKYSVVLPKHNNIYLKYTRKYKCLLYNLEDEYYKCKGCIYCRGIIILYFCDNAVYAYGILNN